MGKWGWKFWGLLLLLLAIIMAGTLIAFNSTPLKMSSSPPMPEVKFDPLLKSPVLEQALKKGFNMCQIHALVKTLKNRDITVVVTGRKDEITMVDFLYGLLQDEESQKIFRQFSANGITIYLANEYKIGNAVVFVDIGDGFKNVKKVARWLATGKP